MKFVNYSCMNFWVQNVLKPPNCILNLNTRTVSERFMDHINNGPYQSLEKYSATKIKAKSLQQLKDLKNNEFIDNEIHYHLKPLNSSAPSFYDKPKIHKPKAPIRLTNSHCGSLLHNFNIFLVISLKAHVQDENNQRKNSSAFSSNIR